MHYPHFEHRKFRSDKGALFYAPEWHHVTFLPVSYQHVGRLMENGGKATRSGTARSRGAASGAARALVTGVKLAMERLPG